jgi:hypothetical protein
MGVRVTTYKPDEDGYYVCLFEGMDKDNKLKGKIRYGSNYHPVVDYFYVSATDDTPTETTDFVRDDNGNIIYLAGDVLRRFFYHIVLAHQQSHDVTADGYDDFILGTASDESIDKKTRADFVSSSWFGPMKPGPINPRSMAANGLEKEFTVI